MAAERTPHFTPSLFISLQMQLLSNMFICCVLHPTKSLLFYMLNYKNSCYFFVLIQEAENLILALSVPRKASLNVRTSVDGAQLKYNFIYFKHTHSIMYAFFSFSFLFRGHVMYRAIFMRSSFLVSHVHSTLLFELTLVGSSWSNIKFNFRN